MSTFEEYKEGASISNNDIVCEVNDKLQKLSTADVSICANCGKEGASNICNKCQVTKYCNAVCKKVHKKKHKKDCEEHVRRAAEKHNEELKRAAELLDIELFKQPPSEEDCPICFMRLPSLDPTGRRYQACCGKMICSGCFYAPVYDNQGKEVDSKKCPFCRIPAPYTDEEVRKREKKRIEANDPFAIYNLGMYYRGRNGYPQDYTKALELWHKAGELGIAKAYVNIGVAYDNGIGVRVDEKKARHYWEQGAIKGDADARHYLGNNEIRAGKWKRAIKHYMIAVRGGSNGSLEMIKQMYSNGHATKEDYTKALQLYQTYLGEIKSDQRDKAALADEDCRYY